MGIIKPENVTPKDWELIKKTYPKNLSEIKEKLNNNYPVQYLIGNVEFYNTIIKVDENVLIPRFETELLVEKAIKFIKSKHYKTIIDLCTGSGAIAITLQKNLKVSVSACDISEEALKIAKINSKDNDTEIEFFKLDILNELPNKKYDCIISNPPYVRVDEYTTPNTKYEPQIALYAKDNGLEFYKRIISTASNYLNEFGSIIFEIGATQGPDIKEFTLKYFPNAKITIEKDYNNYDRYMFIEI